MSGKISVSANGRSGGLVLLWKGEIALTLMSYLKKHIDVEVCDQQGIEWRFTRIYGEPDTVDSGHMEPSQNAETDE
ncbi:hypothetical protein PTKIN_Ptkin08bG0085300 [Pterospermum kingtungense]